MSSLPSADLIADRRALRRKLSLWRLLALVLAAAAVIALGLAAVGFRWRPSDRHVARVSISGVITGDEDTLKLLRNVASARNVEAAVLVINSPGGTTSGAERLHDEIRRLARRKPVVAMVTTMAASGGYIAAIGADGIVAEGNSVVGSIGVLFQYPNVSRLLDMVGVKVEEVKSSPLKASPSPFEAPNEAAQRAIADLVADSYAWFRDLVKTRRNLDEAELARVADGRVFTGRQAVGLKLVDRLGGEREARAWLESEKKVPASLPLREWKPDRGLERLGVFSLAGAAAESLGLEGLSASLRRLAAPAELDGLLSIWQGP
jgi:protease-4